MTQTHFGYETVDETEKAGKVRGVFDSVAKKYDVMNDLMSGGMHRLWKRFAVAISGVREGSQVLDIAGGTGDLSKEFAKQAGPTGEVWRLEENLAPLLGDCRKLLEVDSRFLVLTVYAVRMSALAIGELVKQTFGDLGGAVEMGEMAVREEARGLLLPTAIFARWSRD